MLKLKQIIMKTIIKITVYTTVAILSPLIEAKAIDKIVDLIKEKK